ncbi:MAG: DUF655 domain-containing protein [Candidatus Hodarchaeota archaeon]
MVSRKKNERTVKSKKYEDYVVVLDYLWEGYLEEKPPFKREPIIQAIGEYFFTLLELSPLSSGISIELHQRISIVKERKNKMVQVKRRLTYKDLTATAKAELPLVIEEIVERQIKRFVNWFNKASPITTRMHQLSLLPGIGNKYLWSILEEKKKTPFISFEDIKERTSLSDPKKLIVKRIVYELEREDVKYRLFTRRFKSLEEEESGEIEEKEYRKERASPHEKSRKRY